MAASAETIRAMAGFLGIDAAKEPQLLWLAEKAIIAPLPPGWVEYEDGGVTYYANGEGEAAPTTYEHPNDKLFAQLVAAVRAGAFERCGWEIHWADEGLPYFFHPPSTTTQWTIPQDVAGRSCKSEPAPEPEPEPAVEHADSDSGDEELVAKLHAQQARALKAKSRRAQAKGRRERERKQEHEDKRMRKIAAELKGTDNRYEVDRLRLEGVNSSTKASEPPPRSARSSASGSTVVSAQTDSEDEAFVQKQRDQQRNRRTENMKKERKPKEQKASRSERSAGSDSTTVSAQTDSDDEAFVRAHRARQIEKRQSQMTTERKRVVKMAVGLAQQHAQPDHLEEPSIVQHQEPQGVASADREKAKQTAAALKEREHQSDDVLARAQSSVMTLRQLEQLADSPTPLGDSTIAGISAVTVVSPTVDATLLRALAHSEGDSEEIASFRTDEGDMEDLPALSPRTLGKMDAERKRAVTRRRMFPIPAKDAQTARYGEQCRPQTAPAASGNSARSTRVYDKPWLQEAMIQKAAQTQRARLRQQRKQEWRQRDRQQYKSDDDDPFGLNSCSDSDNEDRDTGTARCSETSRLVQIVDPDHLAMLALGSTMRRAKESYQSELLRRQKEKEREEEEAEFDMVANDGHRVEAFDSAALAKSQAALPQKQARMEVAARTPVEWGGATARARAAIAAQESAQSVACGSENASGKPRPTSAIVRTQNHNHSPASAAADRLGGATVNEAAKQKTVTICDRTTADRLEVKRLVYDYPESVVQKQIAAKQRREAARSTELARRRAERRVAETRGWLVPKLEDKGVEASEEARWRAAAVRREQKRARAQASDRLCNAMSMEKASLAAAAGQTLEQYDMSKQLEKVVQAEIEASPLQEVERLLQVIGIPPPELGQGGKTVRAPLLVDAICTGFIAGFNPLCGTPLAATALWGSIDRTFATDHARAVSAGRSRRNRVKQARVGVAARAAQQASNGAATRNRPHQSGSAASVAQQSSDLQYYTTAERRAAFQREFGTHRPASAGPERARHLRAAANRRKPQDAWWPNTSQAFEGQRGGVGIPPPADQRVRSASGGRRPRSAGVRRAQARRASVLREQGRSNAPRFDPKSGRVVAEAENLDLTPRWKNTFAEDDDGVNESQFGGLMDAIQRKVEAAKLQMVKDQALSEDDSHSCTTVASDDASRHVEYATPH